MAESDPPSSDLSIEQLRRLLEVGRGLVSELDVEVVLRGLLDAARDLTGAAYAAVGTLNDSKEALDRFVYVGVDEQTRHAIGPLPTGKGVLGELIRNPEPLRLADVGAHPRSYGFPANHPPMKSFLGTPVLIRGEAWGNLYLTEKQGGGEFTEADESVAIVLAAWAGVAIENARLYEGLDSRRIELERATSGLEMSADISRAAASGMGVQPLLELIAKRARSLLDADHVGVLVGADGELVVASAAGNRADDLLSRRAWGLSSIPHDLDLAQPGVETIVAAVPFRGAQSGAMVASRSRVFDEDEQRLFESFATSMATTIASVHSAEAARVRLSIRASEEEKQRWARELHDQTLQELGALRFLLETAIGGTSNQLRSASERALEHIDRGIRNLHALITELRPAALDELGIGPAVEGLARETNETTGVPVEVAVDLAHERGDTPTRLTPDLESSIYRIVQESINNAVKHADPESIRVELSEEEGQITVRVTDDGCGFVTSDSAGGFGLIGMHERVELVEGELSVESNPGEGTAIVARLPALRRSQEEEAPGRGSVLGS